MKLFLIILISLVFITSCSAVSYPPRLTKDPRGYHSQEYQECVAKNPKDEAKCELIRPTFMEPNLTEHREKEGYH